ADAQLGTHAERGTDPDGAGAVSCAVSGHRRAAFRAGTQSSRRGTAQPRRSQRMNDAALLEVVDLNVAFGTARVVKELSLEVRRGEILGLVGASGSGKSMTALAIMRLLPRGAAA